MKIKLLFIVLIGIIFSAGAAEDDRIAAIIEDPEAAAAIMHAEQLLSQFDEPYAVLHCSYPQSASGAEIYRPVSSVLIQQSPRLRLEFEKNPQEKQIVFNMTNVHCGYIVLLEGLLQADQQRHKGVQHNEKVKITQEDKVNLHSLAVALQISDLEKLLAPARFDLVERY